MGLNKAWTEEELELLIKLVNVYPLETITEKINSLNRKRNTGISRTKLAVYAQIKRLGYSVLTTEDNMSCLYWAKMFKLSPLTISRWVNIHQLLCEKKGGTFYISRKAMIEFAKRKPHLFKKIDQEILVYYLGEEIIKIISTEKKVCYDTTPKKVKRLDTGEIYQSLSEATRKLNLHRGTIIREAQRNGWLRFVSC